MKMSLCHVLTVLTPPLLSQSSFNRSLSHAFTLRVLTGLSDSAISPQMKSTPQSSKVPMCETGEILPSQWDTKKSKGK